MRALMATTTAVILLGASMASLATAAADGGRATERAGASAQGADDDRIVLRRDGSRAAPFVPYPGPGGAPTNEFDWGDAATGAAGAMFIVLLGSAGWIALRHRRGARITPAGVPN